MNGTLVNGGYSDCDDMNAAQIRLEAAVLMRDAAVAHNSPFALLKPRIFFDGDSWCALLGEDILSGVCGFGDSPRDAARAFDEAWNLKTQKGQIMEFGQNIKPSIIVTCPTP